jgi:hypothetical protein
VNGKLLVRLGTQVAALFAVAKSVQVARDEDDNLRYVEAVVHLAAVVLTTVVIVREVRRDRSSQGALGTAA